MKKQVKICLAGVHGVGKSKICEKVFQQITQLPSNKVKLATNSQHLNTFNDIAFIPEQFREVVKDIPNFTKQTEEMTLATYAKQLYLENLYKAQGKNILCDRSVLDTFVYYDYFNKICNNNVCLHKELEVAYKRTQLNYSKIYLIEPSDRPIEDDGFRMTDKREQLAINDAFLYMFKDFSNVEIINQEDAHKPEFIEKIANELI